MTGGQSRTASSHVSVTSFMFVFVLVNSPVPFVFFGTVVPGTVLFVVYLHLVCTVPELSSTVRLPVPGTIPGYCIVSHRTNQKHLRTTRAINFGQKQDRNKCPRRNLGQGDIQLPTLPPGKDRIHDLKHSVSQYIWSCCNETEIEKPDR
jgi:hypothetical protein